MYTPRSESGELKRQVGYTEAMKTRAYETYLKRLATLEARHASLLSKLTNAMANEA